MPTEQHLFSTGTLTALWSGQTVAYPQASITVTRGGTAAGTDPISNIFLPGSGDIAADFPTNASTGGWQDWAVIDLGMAINVASVTINAQVQSGGAGSVSVYAAAASTDTPGGAGTTILGSAQAFGLVGPYLFAVGSAEVVNTRYLLVGGIPTGTGTQDYYLNGLIVGEAVNYIASGGIAFAVVQEAEFVLRWECRELMTAASESSFPIDIGVGEASWKITAGNIGVRADALAQIVAAQLAFSGSEADLTLPRTISMPPIRAVFEATDTLGDTVTFTMSNAKASGLELPFKLNDFAVQRFTLTAYPDNNGKLGTIAFATA